MKTVNQSGSPLAVRVLAFFVLAVVLTVMSCKDDNNNDDNMATNGVPLTVSGNATGGQVVPAVTGNGTGTITGTYDPSTRVLTYTSNWSGLSGRPITGGFYAGASGSTDSTAVPIGSKWTFDSTATATGTHQGTITLTPDQLNALTAGSWFYSYGTKMHPAAEIRGQMTATQGPITTPK